MGKGDIKTKRGKITRGSYGKKRLRKKVAYKAPDKVVVAEKLEKTEKEVKKTTAKKTTTKKATTKKATTKKATAKKTTTKKLTKKGTEKKSE